MHNKAYVRKSLDFKGQHEYTWIDLIVCIIDFPAISRNTSSIRVKITYVRVLTTMVCMPAAIYHRSNSVSIYPSFIAINQTKGIGIIILYNDVVKLLIFFKRWNILLNLYCILRQSHFTRFSSFIIVTFNVVCEKFGTKIKIGTTLRR